MQDENKTWMDLINLCWLKLRIFRTKKNMWIIRGVRLKTRTSTGVLQDRNMQTLLLFLLSC